MKIEHYQVLHAINNTKLSKTPVRSFVKLWRKFHKLFINLKCQESDLLYLQLAMRNYLNCKCLDTILMFDLVYCMYNNSAYIDLMGKDESLNTFLYNHSDELSEFHKDDIRTLFLDQLEFALIDPQVSKADIDLYYRFLT